MLVPKPYTWLEINKTAFDHNIAVYRSLIGQHSKLSVVLKSNASGHGIKEVGQLCQENNTVDWLCTASLSEAMLLRHAGITKPILVLSIIDEDPVLALMHDIDLPIFDVHTAQIISDLAHQFNKKITVHIKIDTGLSRFGFRHDQANAQITQISQLPGIELRGIFTHCAEGGNPNRTFTLEQLTKFDECIKQLEVLGIHFELKHAFNSGLSYDMPKFFPHFNLVRLGAAAYGLWHFRDEAENYQLPLHQILTWKTKISYIKTVPAHSYVGYDRTYTTSRETIIATIPVGYHDGYDRRFTNVGIMRIKDFYARVVGRICMNATMLEIPEGKEVALGDEVIILGDYDHIRAHDLAKVIGSFNPREITTRLNNQIERQIIKEAVAEKIASPYNSPESFDQL